MTNTTPLYIFDLDGTLALIDHRRPILDNLQDPHRWEKFYDSCDKDLPNKQVIKTLNIFHSDCIDILIFSGRSNSVREKTIEWLLYHTSINDPDKILTMRDEGDYRPDEVIKKEWLYNMLDEDRKRLVAVFDDRCKVVKMWRDNGITCFQVAKGDF